MGVDFFDALCALNGLIEFNKYLRHLTLGYIFYQKEGNLMVLELFSVPYTESGFIICGF